MAQAQLDLVREEYRRDFKDLNTNLLKKEVCCIIDDTTKIVVKKRGQQTHIQLVVKGKKLSICRDVWTKLCDLKESILFLHSFIDEH